MNKPNHFPRVRRGLIDYTESHNVVYRLEAVGSFPAMLDEGWDECATYVRGIVGNDAAISTSGSDFLIGMHPSEDIMNGNAPAYTALMKKLGLTNRSALVDLHFTPNRPSELLLAVLSTTTNVADLTRELRGLQGAINTQEEVKGEWTLLTVSFKGTVGMRYARKRLDNTSLKGEYALRYRPS